MVSANNDLKNLKKIAIDTNMLLSIVQFKTDIFSMLNEMFGKSEIFIPKQVLHEMDLIEKKNLTQKKEVGIAKQLLEKNNVKVIEIEAQNADSALLELAKRGFLIATNDKELRKNIKTVGGQIIYLKRKKFLEIG